MYSKIFWFWFFDFPLAVSASNLAAAAFLCAVGISHSISSNALNVVEITKAPV